MAFRALMQRLRRICPIWKGAAVAGRLRSSSA